MYIESMRSRVLRSYKDDWSRVTLGETSVYKQTLEYIITYLQEKPQRIE